MVPLFEGTQPPPCEIVNDVTNFCGCNLHIITTLLPNNLIDYALYYSTRNIQIHLTLQLYHTLGSLQIMISPVTQARDRQRRVLTCLIKISCLFLDFVASQGSLSNAQLNIYFTGGVMDPSLMIWCQKRRCTVDVIANSFVELITRHLMLLRTYRLVTVPLNARRRL